MLDTLNDFFSFFCGQSPHRCFWLGGEVLPVCQRCLGVYCGLLIGVLAAPGAFRREAVVPGWSGRVLLGGAIAAMVVMGFHLIDPGPMPRFLGGCAFGAALAWLGLPVAKLRWLLLPARTATVRETALFCLILASVVACLALGLGLDNRAAYVSFSLAAVLGWLVGFGLLVALALSVFSDAIRRFRAKPWKRLAGS